MNGQHLEDMILLSNLENPQEKELSGLEILACLFIIVIAAAIFILVVA